MWKLKRLQSRKKFYDLQLLTSIILFGVFVTVTSIFTLFGEWLSIVITSMFAAILTCNTKWIINYRRKLIKSIEALK